MKLLLVQNYTKILIFYSHIYSMHRLNKFIQLKNKTNLGKIPINFVKISLQLTHLALNALLGWYMVELDQGGASNHRKNVRRNLIFVLKATLRMRRLLLGAQMPGAFRGFARIYEVGWTLVGLAR